MHPYLMTRSVCRATQCKPPCFCHSLAFTLVSNYDSDPLVRKKKEKSGLAKNKSHKIDEIDEIGKFLMQKQKPYFVASWHGPSRPPWLRNAPSLSKFERLRTDSPTYDREVEQEALALFAT